DVRRCTNLRELPTGLHVSTWLDIGQTAIRRLPSSRRGARIYWNGVPIDERIAFHPETITVLEILHETNLLPRRLLLQLVGLDWFITRVTPIVLDVDKDAGGLRRLLLVSLRGDEDIVCLSVRCPSTKGRHHLRVPPTMRTCRQAIA